MTLRDLLVVCSAHTDQEASREKAGLRQAAVLMAFYANANRDPKKSRRPFTPSDFLPFAFEDAPSPIPVADLEERERRALEREAAYLQALALRDARA